MGWSGGSELAFNIWKLVRPMTTSANRKKTAKKIVDLFENEDCDTMYECEELMKDAGIEPEE